MYPKVKKLLSIPPRMGNRDPFRASFSCSVYPLLSLIFFSSFFLLFVGGSLYSRGFLTMPIIYIKGSTVYLYTIKSVFPVFSDRFINSYA